MKGKRMLVLVLVFCAGIGVTKVFFDKMSSSFSSNKVVASSGKRAVSAVSIKSPASNIVPPPSLVLTSTAPVPAAKRSSSRAGLSKDVSSSFQLTGIFTAANGTYALINNEIVREGEKINNARVAQITIDYVELEIDGALYKINTAR